MTYTVSWVLVLWALLLGGDAPDPQSGAVQLHNGRPTIFIDGEPRAPMLYALTDVPGGRWSWEELPQHNIENFCRRGIRLFQLDLFLEHLWTAPGQFDIERARRQVAGVREVCPEASIFFRFHLRAPRWWLQEHPEEWVAYADTTYVPEQRYGLLRIIEDDNNAVRRVSMASEKWRTAVTEKFRQFLRAFAQTPEGNALVGIQVANGVYGEWHNWGFYANEPDVSVPMARAFRQRLRETYETNEALQAAWHDSEVTFETARVPGMEARASDSIIRDPARQRRVIDYYESMHRVVADNIIHFARVVKETWPRPIITGTFYGYYFSTFGRQAAGGHLQLQRILTSEHIDYLSGPQAYGPASTDLGDPYRSRSLIASVRLHGKLWLDEMDIEPTIPIFRRGRYDKLLQHSVASVRRNVMFSYTKGMGLWFYDFGVSGVDLDGFRYRHKGSQGTWDHPALMTDIERMQTIIEDRIDTPYRSAADVLFVYDTESLYYAASLEGADPVSPALIDHNTLAAFRSGVVFDPIHLDDLDRVDLASYKMVVFGNTYVLSEAERRFIRERVARDGRHLVWFYTPGYVMDRAGGLAYSDPAHVSSLTQIELTPLPPMDAPTVEMVASPDSTLRYTLSEDRVAPLFAVTDDAAQPLGYFAETEQVAIARKELSDHTAWYVSLPSRGLQPMQRILQEGGAHVYNDSGDIFYGGGGVLVMHTLEGGARSVTLKNGRSVVVDLPDGAATVLLDSDTGAVVLQDYSGERAAATVSYEGAQ